jgi:hypothetical protein
MIIETIFSTLNETGVPNFAPMGLIWGEEEMIVRPFRDTTTYRNLAASNCGVANVTDNVLMFVHSALTDAQFPHFPAANVRGVVLQDACYWRELLVSAVDGSGERAEIRCRVVGWGQCRHFLGFNRGKNAVIEAAILATRLEFYGQAEVLAALQNYDEIVAKTGGEQESEAMRYLRDYVGRWFDASAS